MLNPKQLLWYQYGTQPVVNKIRCISCYFLRYFKLNPNFSALIFVK